MESGFLRFLSSPHLPHDFISGHTPDSARTLKLWDNFKGHWQVQKCHQWSSDLWIVTPNAAHVPWPPLMEIEHPPAYSDSRWGKHEWPRIAQVWKDNTPHCAWVYELPERNGKEDPAFVAIYKQEELLAPQTCLFSTNCWQTQEGRPAPDLVCALLDLYFIELMAAEQVYFDFQELFAFDLKPSWHGTTINTGGLQYCITICAHLW